MQNLVDECLNKKITIFIPNLGGGGAERVVCNLANSLILSGIRVEILLLNEQYPSKYYVNPLVKICYLNCSRVAFSVPHLIAYFKKNNPDVFLSVLTHANIAAIVSGALIGKLKKIYISEHGIFDHTFETGFKQKIIRFFATLLYPLANKVIAVSDAVKRSLEENLHLSSCKVIRIYNPIVDFETNDNLAISENKNAIIKNKQIPVILSAGRFCKEKDFLTLLRAFRLVLNKMPARLVLLGDGPDKAEITEYIKKLELVEHVDTPGFVNNIEFWMSEAKLFVLSSPRESFGNVIVEAMSQNLQVISTDCGGPREILEGGFWGKLVPVGDYVTMASEIIDVLSSSKKIDTRLRALDFNISRQAAEYKNLLFNS